MFQSFSQKYVICINKIKPVDIIIEHILFVIIVKNKKKKKMFCTTFVYNKCITSLLFYIMRIIKVMEI